MQSRCWTDLLLPNQVLGFIGKAPSDARSERKTGLDRAEPRMQDPVGFECPVTGFTRKSSGPSSGERLVAHTYFWQLPWMPSWQVLHSVIKLS